MPSPIAEIAVTLPVRGRFHYTVPEPLHGRLEVGHRVLVPFGPRRVTGFVVDPDTEVETPVLEKLRPIASLMDETPLVPKDVLRLASFCADYYLGTIGEVLKIALPPGLTGASVLRLVATAEGRRWLSEDEALSNRPKLGRIQAELLKAAAKGLGVKGPRVRSKAADQLLELKLVRRKESLDAKEVDPSIEVAERIADEEAAWPTIRRAPKRRELWERLETGPIPVQHLIDLNGRTSTRTALKKLEAAGLVQISKVPPQQLGPPTPSAGTDHLEPTLPPTPEQADALTGLIEAFDSGQPKPFLLQGVTGSGKTEIYLRIIGHALEQGRGAIVLVPEIALTPQLAARFEARFGNEVVVLHSGLSDTERRRGWRRLREAQARIALGPRSALWAPVSNLGVLVVDEEHDPSFKQNSDVRYHGRDLALVRGRDTQSLVVLGSATPSLESLHLVEQGRFERLTLTQRVADRPMPVVELVDLARERQEQKGEVPLISRRLADGLREVLARGEQAILFLNRRGFNTIVYCVDCAEPRRCPRCTVSLTHHRAHGRLACHYCGYETRLESPCPKCESLAMQPMGAGTERAADAVREEVPDARILRLDRDITQKPGALQSTLQDFREHRADVLVGTQMVAKGHDFPRVTLVGILLADSSLAFPDFRAAERTFQLLTQVAGRAGRADAPGRVVVQTFQPEHYALQSASKHDVTRFVEIEMPSREDAGYPPYGRMGLVRVESKNQTLARATAERAARVAERSVVDASGRVLGPIPAPIERLRERWRFQVMILCHRPAQLLRILRHIRVELEDLPRVVDLLLDVDPLDLL